MEHCSIQGLLVVYWEAPVLVFVLGCINPTKLSIKDGYTGGVAVEKIEV